MAGLGKGEVFAYFNNDSGGAAVRDARALIGMLDARGVSVPA
jgi:uncharacterized protein YecE (DUF72 family)